MQTINCRANIPCQIPAHIHDSIVLYIEQGILPGHCLTAIFSNDLFTAFNRADDKVAAAMKDIIVYIYNYAPSGCWGSPSAVKSWSENGGWYGKYFPKDKPE